MKTFLVIGYPVGLSIFVYLYFHLTIPPVPSSKTGSAAHTRWPAPNGQPVLFSTSPSSRDHGMPGNLTNTYNIPSEFGKPLHPPYLRSFTADRIDEIKLDPMAKFFKSPCVLEYIESGSDANYSLNKFTTTKTYPWSRKVKKVLSKNAPTRVRLSIHRSAHAESYRLRCFPYFMLIGTPKSATTDFSSRISKHPAIWRSPRKELVWWDHFRYLINSTLSDYSDFFDTVLMQTVTNNSLVATSTYNNATYCEFSANTLTVCSYWNTTDPKLQGGPLKLTPHAVKAALPKTKFLVMLRHPTKRLYSMFHMIRSRSKTPASEMPELFHKEVLAVVEWWKNCTALHDVRYCTYYPVQPVQMNARFFATNLFSLGGVRESMYSLYLRDWFQVFPRAQFLIIRAEDYMGQEVKVLSEEVFPFLDVRRLNSREISNIETKHEKVAGSAYPAMWNETRALLDELYAPYMQDLAELLGDRRWLWLDTAYNVAYTFPKK